MPTPTIYNYITKSAALQQIANRLYDPTMQFWSQGEIGLCLNESLQTWNALTSYWRGDFILNSSDGSTWYDIPFAANSLRPYTLHDTDIYTSLQYHLLEPASWNPWIGPSAQFGPDDLMNAVARRRDEVLSLTGCTISHRTIPAIAGRITLPDTVIDVRRMAYLPSPLFPSQLVSVMWPEDAWAEQSFNRNYTITPAGTPFTYLMSAQPPLSFDTDRPPAYSGNYELLTVEAGPPISAFTPTLLNIPDDWAHVIKWGALADLLSRESNAKDIPRATYSEQRYRMGIATLMNASALLALRVNDVSLQIDAVRNVDLYNPSWEQSSLRPVTIAVQTGLNLLAFDGFFGSPYGVGYYGVGPYSGAKIPFSITATVVRNAPLPSALTDPVQVSRGDIDAIIDYAQHLAAFKQGGEEFTRTMPLLQRFLKAASAYNGKLAEIAEFSSALLGVSQMERGANPLMTPSAEQEVSS
jgi:hypothetical protein